MQSLLDTAGNLASWHRRVFQPERDFAVDDVVDRLQLGILKYEALMAGHVARGRRDDIASGDISAAGDPSAMEMRHETVEDPEQRRLAASRWAGHHRQPVVDRQAYILQRGLIAPRIPVGEVGQRRDRHTSTGVKRSKQAAMGQGWIGGEGNGGSANKTPPPTAAPAAAKTP